MTYYTTDIRRMKFDIKELVNDMLNSLPNKVFTSKTTTFCDLEMGGGQYLYEVINRLRKAGHSDKNISNRVYGVSGSLMGMNIAQNQYKLIGQFQTEDFDMKFDVIVGNPPYQTETNGKSRPIWDKFVLKAFDHLNDNGYLVMVHPSGWRNVTGRFEPVRDLLYSKQLEYLEIHNEKDGKKTFGANTRYDWYCVKNSPSKKNDKILVKFEDGTSKKIVPTKLPFIPNHSYDKITKLIAKPGEETVEVLNDSAYHTQREHISKTKTKKFKYPCVYHVNVKDVPSTFYWSSTNDKGHFGIPKLIWIPNARLTGTGYYVDIKGEYGLTEFAIGIVDTPANLKKIQKAIKSQKFRDIISATFITYGGITHKLASVLRKDFWKDFV